MAEKSPSASQDAKAAPVSGKSTAKPIRCVVTSDRMSKSRVAVSETVVKHPRVKKYMRRRSKFMFHDEQNLTGIGDEVLIRPCRPMSSRKKFMLVEVVKKAQHGALEIQDFN